MQVDIATLRAQIHRAFDAVETPARVEDMRLPRYTGDDSYEMAAAFAGKRWSELPIAELFAHRESLATLGAKAYRAYLPAYLLAAIASDDPFDKHGADLRRYLVSTLAHWPHQDEHRAAETRERLSLLDAEQRAAVAEVLRYLETKWQLADAGEILRGWDR